MILRKNIVRKDLRRLWLFVAGFVLATPSSPARFSCWDISPTIMGQPYGHLAALIGGDVQPGRMMPALSLEGLLGFNPGDGGGARSAFAGRKPRLAAAYPSPRLALAKLLFAVLAIQAPLFGQ